MMSEMLNNNVKYRLTFKIKSLHLHCEADWKKLCVLLNHQGSCVGLIIGERRRK